MTFFDAYYADDSRRRVRPSYKPRIDPDYLSDAFRRKLNKALPSQPNQKFAVHFQKLDALGTDRTLLVGCTEPPSPLTLARARAVLHQLETEGLEPTRVVSSAEGGVAICFVSGDKYSDIECLNSEEILGVVSNRRDHPIVWKIDPSASGFARAAARIRDFLSSTTRSHDAEWETR
jgi:hypothetical protein